MVKIRLTRGGAKKRPYYRIIAIDERKPRNGRPLEYLGTFDPKSEPENPRWFLVDVKFVRKLKRTISLAELKEHDAIAEMVLLRRGNRLSIMPVSKSDWDYILALE